MPIAEQFSRSPAREGSSLIVSVCRYCHLFVTAARSDHELRLMERLHRCIEPPFGPEADSNPAPPQR